MKISNLPLTALLCGAPVLAQPHVERVVVEADAAAAVERVAKVGAGFELRYFEKQRRLALAGSFTPLSGRSIDDLFVHDLLCASLGCEDINYRLAHAGNDAFPFIEIADNYTLIFDIIHTPTGAQIADEQVVVVVDSDAITSIHGAVFQPNETSQVVGDSSWLWHRNLGEVRYQTTETERHLVDRSGKILRTAPILDSVYESSSCVIPRQSFSSTSMTQFAAGTVSETLPCGRQNDGSLVCHWQLSREAAGTVHQLGRITEEGVSQAVQSSLCSEPSATVSQRLNQQNAYAWIYKFRAYVFDRMWNVVTRDQHANVQINIQNSPCFGLYAACFNGNLTDIYIASSVIDSAGGIQTLFHEYGHYVNWSYGSFSSWCDPGSDEGDALEETFADLEVLAFIARGTIISSTYQQPGMFISQFPGRHRDGATKLTYDSSDCTNIVPYDEHDVGKPLEQALWEILWNQDCETGDTCPNALTAFGNDIFIATGHTRTVINSIIAEAIARALQATSQNVTYDEILYYMSLRVGSLTDPGTRARFDSVLIHHGFNP